MNFLFTHTDERLGSKAFIHVCLSVCLSVCVHLCVCLSTRQNHYNYQTCHRDRPSRVLAAHLILGQKVKGQGHMITKCKNIYQAIEWLARVCTVSSGWPASSSEMREVIENALRYSGEHLDIKS